VFALKQIRHAYDKQEVLLGVNRPGMFMGEIPLLLDAPWHALVRVSKPSRLFRLNQENFWRMLSTCHSVAREIFRTAANRLRNLEGYSQQRQKLVSLGTMAAAWTHFSPICWSFQSRVEVIRSPPDSSTLQVGTPSPHSFVASSFWTAQTKWGAFHWGVVCGVIA
jgi:CRP-like cAMP-binding protein